VGVVAAEPFVSRNDRGVVSDAGPGPHATTGGCTKQGSSRHRALLHVPSSDMGANRWSGGHYILTESVDQRRPAYRI